MRLVHQEEMFDALADGSRRRLLVFLLAHESRDVPELSGVSAEMAEMNDALLGEYLSGPQNVDGVDEGLLRTHCVHLPKLDESDFVDWDEETNVVTKGTRFDEMRSLLELLENANERAAPVSEVRLRR